MFTDLLAAVALVLVFEGIMPFINPTHFRRTLMTAARLHDRTLRTLGLISMVFGVCMLYLVR